MSRLFGDSVQVAMVVPDIDREIERMVSSGIGPVFVMRRIRLLARHRGEQNNLLITAAFVYSGDIQYEFIEQHDETPSAYREFLETHPSGGFHHVAHFCVDFELALQQARECGVPVDVVQEFVTPEGVPYEIYVEPVGIPDPLVSQLVLEGPLQDFFAQMRRAASDWDGTDPVRDAVALLPEAMRPPTEAGRERSHWILSQNNTGSTWPQSSKPSRPGSTLAGTSSRFASRFKRSAPVLGDR